MIKYLLLLAMSISFSRNIALAADFRQDQFEQLAQKINPEAPQAWPVQSNGRRKPFLSLARESTLFLTGKYSFWGLPATSFFLGLMIYPEAKNLPIIEVRFPDLREKLGFARDKRYFSVSELRASTLMALAEPLSKKQQANRRTLTEIENKTLEVADQVFLAEGIIEGGVLAQALIGVSDEGKLIEGHSKNDHSAVIAKVQGYIEAIKSGIAQSQVNEGNVVAQELLASLPVGDVPVIKEKIDKELLYHRLRPFSLAAWLSLLVTILLLVQTRKTLLPFSALIAVSALPLLIEAYGFFLRISVTGFAPVTNMFGTMLWVALGVGAFSLILFSLYRHLYLAAMLNLGVFLLLTLTESIPLVLSPDMDPIVAVLRSNFWLTIHVLTITISYAAFTIAMLIGNTALIRDLFGRADSVFVKTYSHFTYRVIQLGVFLLTAGIILGGIWADYSWGRFWGWDPKETWALIADLGFLVLLHARFVQWIGPFGLMIFSPIAYLLVIMAWYGVNFILAAGLHSYGFSSGGAKLVATFVVLQIIIFAASIVKNQLRLKTRT